MFLIDCVDTVYPYKKAASEEDLEEERRMFYVGVTRAKDWIFFYDVKKMHRHPASPSPFLAEMTQCIIFVGKDKTVEKGKEE